MHGRPHIVAIDLNRDERDLCSYWLSQYQVIFHDSLDRPPQGSSIHYYRNGNTKTVGELMDWNVPLLSISGVNSDPDAIRKSLFSVGCGAHWAIPPRNRPIIFPDVNFPPVKRPAFLHIKDGSFRRLIRQILLFSGRPVRGDFRSSDEMAIVLDEIGRKEESELLWPSLIVIDLDAPDSHAGRIVDSLKKLMRNHPSLKRETRVLLMKDFDVPGRPLTGLAQEVRSLVNRVFHPFEATLALMESLLLHGEIEEYRSQTLRIRSLDDFLFGHLKNFPGESPVQRLEASLNDAMGFTRALPFLWLHEYLLAERKNMGITLTPSKEILFEQDGRK